MQVSRHWRMNGPRYRLEGFTLASGEHSLQPKKQLTCHSSGKEGQPTGAPTSTETKSQGALQGAVASAVVTSLAR